MTWTEAALVITAFGSLGLAAWTVIKERRKPQLDETQVKQLKTEVEKESRKLNYDRDRRILDLEVWGDSMRPWARAVVIRDDQMVNLIREAYVRLGMPMPVIDSLPPMPKFPEPRDT